MEGGGLLERGDGGGGASQSFYGIHLSRIKIHHLDRSLDKK